MLLSELVFFVPAQLYPSIALCCNNYKRLLAGHFHNIGVLGFLLKNAACIDMRIHTVEWRCGTTPFMTAAPSMSLNVLMYVMNLSYSQQTLSYPCFIMFSIMLFYWNTEWTPKWKTVGLHNCAMGNQPNAVLIYLVVHCHLSKKWRIIILIIKNFGSCQN